MRQGRVASHARPHVLEFLVTRFGDVLGHLAALSGIGALLPRDHQQPSAIRRQRAGFDLHLGAQVDRGRRARGIGLAPCLGLLLRGLALGAVVGQRADRAQLLLAQRIGLGRGQRIAFGLEFGDDGGAGAGGPAVPAVARPPEHRAIGTEARLLFHLMGAGDLGQRSAAQVAHEQVAVAREQHALAGGIVDRVRGVQVRALVVSDAMRGGAVERLLEGVAHAAAVALEFVLHLFAVPGPPGAFHRRTDPVRFGHRLFQRERRGRLGVHRGGEGERQQQGKQGGAHRASVSAR